MSEEYKFKKSAGFNGDAKATYLELERIRIENDGKLETASIVEAARDEDSPLHRHFDWDDSRAAESYRRMTARKLVRSIEICYVEAEQREKPKRIYIHVQEGGAKDGAYYQNIECATFDEFESALDGLKRRAASLMTSVEQIEDAARNEEQKSRARTAREKTTDYVDAVGAV